MFQLDTQGRPILEGRREVKYETVFPGGVLPSWLTLDTVSPADGASVVASVLAEGGIKVTSAATNGKRWRLLGPTELFSNLAFIRMREIFTGGTTNGSSHVMGMMAADNALHTRHYAGSSSTSLFTRWTASLTDEYIGTYDITRDKRYDVTVILDPSDASIAICEGDQPFLSRTFGAAKLASSVVTPVWRWDVQTGAVAAAKDYHYVSLEYFYK